MSQGEEGKRGEPGMGQTGGKGGEGGRGGAGDPPGAGGIGGGGGRGAPGARGPEGKAGRAGLPPIWKWGLTIWIIAFTLWVYITWDSTRELANDNRGLITDIQSNRLYSCKQNYEGVSKIFFGVFVPPPNERTQRQKDIVQKFNREVKTLKMQCDEQVDPNNNNNGGS